MFAVYPTKPYISFTYLPFIFHLETYIEAERPEAKLVVVRISNPIGLVASSSFWSSNSSPLRRKDRNEMIIYTKQSEATFSDYFVRPSVC